MPRGAEYAGEPVQSDNPIEAGETKAHGVPHGDSDVRQMCLTILQVLLLIERAGTIFLRHRSIWQSRTASWWH